MKSLIVLETGLTPYPTALRWQEQLLAARLSNQVNDLLLLLEHPPVLTVGRQGGWENLLVS
ncbi:MAG: hypothetical protein AB1556_06330 [Bacillota bacterium]